MSAAERILIPIERYERIERAARPYPCDCCGGQIDRGTTYRLIVEVRNGQVIRWREHDEGGMRCVPF